MQMLQRLNMQARRREAVENRLRFHGSEVELAVYDTYEPAEQVALRSDNVLYCAMLSGTKRMHGVTDTPELFLPSESFVLAPGQPVYIDFPDARPDTPTTCIAIDISPQRIQAVADRLNQQPRAFAPYQYKPDAVHCRHSHDTQRLLERLVHSFIEPQPERELLIDLQLTELVMRLLRQQSRELLLSSLQCGHIHHGLLAAMEAIAQRLSQPLNMDWVSTQACISKAQLYRLFKQELGVTPGEYQQQQRLALAQRWLTEGQRSITDIAFELGYLSLSHFNRRFKAATGCNPSQYRQRRSLPGQ